MSYDSYEAYQAKIAQFFIDTKREKDDGTTGWGFTYSKRSPPSVTNTAEALEACEAVGILHAVLTPESKPSIVAFVKNMTEVAQLNPRAIRTRDIAMAMLAFDVLGERDLARGLTATLNGLRIGDGWPVDAQCESASLLATFHAVKALAHIGEPIDQKITDWTISCCRTEGLCSWSPHDDETDFGASCLALYTLSLSKGDKSKRVLALGKAVLRQMAVVFGRIHLGDYSWVRQEPHSNFNILAYGHGLRALAYFGFDVAEANAEVLFQGQPLGTPTNWAQYDYQSLDSAVTKLPAIVEHALAVTVIRESYDPFRSVAKSACLSAENQVLAEETSKLRFRQAVFDEWEKSLIRERIDNKALRDSLAAQVADEVSNRLIKEAAERRAISERRRNIALAIVLVAVLILSIPGYKMAAGRLDIASIESFMYMFFGLLVSYLTARHVSKPPAKVASGTSSSS